jgi:hypothetical protein
MEGLVMGAAIAKMAIKPLLAEQRRTGDEYRRVEKIVQHLHKTLVATKFDQALRAKTQESIVAQTIELMRLGNQMLEHDASVTALTGSQCNEC